MLARGDRDIVAVASDAALADLSVPVLPLDDPPAVAAFVAARCGLAPAGIKAGTAAGMRAEADR